MKIFKSMQPHPTPTQPLITASLPLTPCYAWSVMMRLASWADHSPLVALARTVSQVSSNSNFLSQHFDFLTHLLIWLFLCFYVYICLHPKMSAPLGARALEPESPRSDLSSASY